MALKHARRMGRWVGVLIVCLGSNGCGAPESKSEFAHYAQPQGPVVALPEPDNLPEPPRAPVSPGDRTPKRASLPKLTVLAPKEPVKLPAPSAALPNFAAIKDVKTKKRRFFAFLRPLIRAENARLAEQRVLLLRLHRGFQADRPLSRADKRWLRGLCERYGVPTTEVASDATFRRLLLRVDTVPMELALIQAANESAWGTSRFARRGNNLYGQWCFKKGCGIVPRRRSSGATHEVATFVSPIHSVRAYLRNLNAHPAYHRFRILRYAQRRKDQEPDGRTLALGLRKYSENGMAYVRTLRSMMAQNAAFI